MGLAEGFDILDESGITEDCGHLHGASCHEFIAVLDGCPYIVSALRVGVGTDGVERMDSDGHGRVVKHLRSAGVCRLGIYVA